MVPKQTIITLLSFILTIGFVNMTDTNENEQQEESVQLSKKSIKLLNSADEHFKKENYAKALEIYNKIMDKQETIDPMYYNRRAICYLKTFDLEKALTEFQSIVDSGRKTDILDAPSFVELGSEFRTRQEFQKAVWCYSRAIELDSSNRSYILSREYCNRRMNNIEEALADMRLLLKMDPDANKDILDELENLIYQLDFDENVKGILLQLSKDRLVDLGSRELKEVKFDEAMYCFNAAIEKDHNDATIYNKRGKCFVMMHRPNEAIVDFRKASELAPRARSTPLYNLIGTLLSVRNFEEALNEMRTLDKKGLVQLANHFMSKNRFESALFIYNASIEKYCSEASFYHLRGKCYRQIKEDIMAMSDGIKTREMLKLPTSDPDEHLLRFFNFTELTLSGGYDENVKYILSDLLDATQLLELTKRFLINNRLTESNFVCVAAISKFPNDEPLNAINEKIWQKMDSRSRKSSFQK